MNIRDWINVFKECSFIKIVQDKPKVRSDKKGE
jgi:hypothetical protein